MAAACDCGRRPRLSGAVYDAGPITCGLCGTDFTSGTEQSTAASAATQQPPPREGTSTVTDPAGGNWLGARDGDVEVIAGNIVVTSSRVRERPPRARPDPAEVARLLALVQRRHGRAVQELRQQMFRPEPTSRTNLPPRLVANSVADRHALVTLVADMNDIPAEMSAWPPGSSIVTVSIAGHVRALPRQRLPLDIAEEEAWVRAVLGPEWSPHAYAAGCLGQVNNGPASWQYKLVLNKDHQPTTWPPGDPWPVELRRLDSDAEQP